MDLVYRVGARSAEDLAGEIAAFWRDFETQPELRHAVATAGVRVERLNPRERAALVRVAPRDSGLDPISTSMIITVGSTVALDLWRHVLLPRIERRLGGDAIGDQADDDDDDGSGERPGG